MELFTITEKYKLSVCLDCVVDTFTLAFRVPERLFIRNRLQQMHGAISYICYSGVVRCKWMLLQCHNEI